MSLLYVTAINCFDRPKIGGLWRLHRQEGFPIDISLLICQEKEYEIDWIELLADAESNNELASLERQIDIPPMAAYLYSIGRRKESPADILARKKTITLNSTQTNLMLRELAEKLKNKKQ